jgi:hypothetical protein
VSTVQKTLADAINAVGRECCGHNALDDGIADAQSLLAELERHGWRLVQADPFAQADPPPGCCGGWVGPSGERTMCCPVASQPARADVEPPSALDVMTERLTKIEDWLDAHHPNWSDSR